MYSRPFETTGDFLLNFWSVKPIFIVWYDISSFYSPHTCSFLSDQHMLTRVLFTQKNPSTFTQRFHFFLHKLILPLEGQPV